jgi:hypothetical protein
MQSGKATVLERLMPALDLALGHRMIRRATDVPDILAIEPFGQVCRDVAGAVVGEKQASTNAAPYLQKAINGWWPSRTLFRSSLCFSSASPCAII